MTFAKISSYSTALELDRDEKGDILYRADSEIIIKDSESIKYLSESLREYLRLSVNPIAIIFVPHGWTSVTC